MLVKRVRVQDDAANPAAAAFLAVWEGLHPEISRWVGTTGCRALLLRALRGARSKRPALAVIEVGPDMQLRLNGLVESVPAEAGPVAAALEALLVDLIELLGRFIGEDMVAKLVERSVADQDPEGRQDVSRETQR